jgi:cytoskeleton protein RodZ
MAVTEAIISFSASGMSWIKVTDSQGKVTLQKTLAAGETASANGQPPLSVVVGKVDATQVQVRGKTFDLQTVARENVARFEVK